VVSPIMMLRSPFTWFPELRPTIVLKSAVLRFAPALRPSNVLPRPVTSSVPALGPKATLSSQAFAAQAADRASSAFVPTAVFPVPFVVASE
ncbi:MAG: hypothetical protein AAGA30_14435, partial [Planctomycetota bacterium]